MFTAHIVVVDVGCSQLNEIKEKLKQVSSEVGLQHINSVVYEPSVFMGVTINA
jgi:hypothetical protein